MKLIITYAVICSAFILSVGMPDDVIVNSMELKPLEANSSPLVAPCELDVVECDSEINNKKIYATVYAYNSEVGQTDESPFITANGTRVKDGIIANNCLSFGTRVRIKEKEYEVQDKMNSRYGCEVFDIWMESKQDAINWGKQYLEINLIK
jgi:3D (Asp-Asp-Asp) domain-containing protein